MLVSLLEWMRTQGSLVEWLNMLGEWGIVAVILYEGRIVLKEYRSSRLFDAIKYVEESDTRAARKVIYEKLWQSKPASKNWWEQDGYLADAASIVSARYNLLGVMTVSDASVRKFVKEEWAHNICTMYVSLRNYLEYREKPPEGVPGSFRRFRELYEEAHEYRAAKSSN